MRRSKLLSLCLTCLLLFVYSPLALAQTQTAAHAPALPPAEMKAAERITAARLSERLYYVASDQMDGRDTPSPGLDATAKFIADNIKRWGIKPGGDNGTYFQRIPLRRTKVDQAQTHAELGDHTFKLGTDFLPANQSGTAEGALVYAGDGWYVPAKHLNPYENLDVRDRVIIANMGRPAGITRGDLRGKPGEDWADPATYAQTHGARAVVLIPAATDLNDWWNRRLSALERGSFVVENPSEAASSSAPAQQAVPTIYASAALLNILFAGETVSGADLLTAAQTGHAHAPFALDPKKVLRLAVNVTTEQQ